MDPLGPGAGLALTGSEITEIRSTANSERTALQLKMRIDEVSINGATSKVRATHSLAAKFP
jgi:hypothetical protein